jgi:hypothetical protein
MKVTRGFGAAVASAGLVFGLSGVAGATSGTIGTTGPFSNNQISSNEINTGLYTSNNSLPIHSANAQSAHTGSANVAFNNTGGSAMTGAANNSNSTNVVATVSNGGAGGMLGGTWGVNQDSATITTTGPSSNNQVFLNRTNTMTVTNNNSVPITTVNTQTALSGSANVSGNTFGGSAITGNASNTNTQTISVNVTN